MTHDPREALEIVQQMIRGKPMEAWITDIRTMKSLGDVVQEALTASPGVVSVELLNIERATGDRLRSENDKLRATIASPGEQKPVAWIDFADNRNVRLWTSEQRRADAEMALGRKMTPVYTSAPPAAGWNEAIEAAAKHIEMRAGSVPDRQEIAAEIRALRREAPAPEGVVGKWAVCERCGGSCGCRVPAPSRPDAGGGVREQLAEALAENKALRAANTQLVLAERDRIEAALSTSPAAVESNASVEARLMEALAELTCRSQAARDYIGSCSTLDEDGNDRFIKIVAIVEPLERAINNAEEALSLAGDKKSEGGLAPGCCSAVLPCSHQKRDPTTICDTCKVAQTNGGG